MSRVCVIVYLVSLFLTSSALSEEKPPEGIWTGYDGEWRYVTSQLTALAEATPEEKFAWRPSPAARSTSEVYMHIALSNFYLLSLTGAKVPDISLALEKSVKSKAQVSDWLKRSLEAVKVARTTLTPADLRRKVHVADRDTNVDGMYLRIVVHANEHMGQLIAYARMTGIVPPWSKQ